MPGVAARLESPRSSPSLAAGKLEAGEHFPPLHWASLVCGPLAQLPDGQTEAHRG